MVAETLTRELRPQSGPQEKFLATSADVAVYGGAAGGGKTYALLLEASRHTQTPGFAAVIFRRTYPEIMEPGGLWDESETIYPALGGIARRGDLIWEFPSGAVIKFAHMQHDKDRKRWQGSQIALIGWDELTHFTRGQFWFMFSRNRTLCGVKPYIRATTNPEPDHWVRDLIRWWIDEHTGLAIPERQGVVRYMARDDEEIAWADNPDELRARSLAPRSFTFVAARLEDNPALVRADPGYRDNLMTLPRFDRERLLFGNWNAQASAGDYFQKAWFPVIAEAPAPMSAEGYALYRDVRYWDRAATEPSHKNPDPDWTVGLKMRHLGGRYCILDIVRFRGRPARVEKSIVNTAKQDGPETTHVLEGDPGSAGVAEIDYLIKALAGFAVKTIRASKSKQVRARPASSQAEAGNIDVLRAAWNDAFFTEVEAFPAGAHDDQVDTLSGAINYLTIRREVQVQWL